MTEYQKFRELVDEQYDGCTLEQKLTLYLQHRPAAAVPFLLELVLELHPVEDKDNGDSE